MLPLSSLGRILLFFRRLPVWILSFILALVLLFSLQYYKIEIFHREENKRFSGNNFYNPYENYSVATLKANFHTHSKKKRNPVNNPNESGKIYDHYKSNGYDIISLSDYQKVTKDITSANYIPVYEHGYNIGKTHQLVFNSDKVVYSDFSLFQNYDTKQEIINKINLSGALIALAHPNLMGGYKEEEMKYLKGYDFIEILGNYKTSVNIWDAALTSGYPAWLLSGDDCHDIRIPDFTFNNWTRISSAGQSREEIIAALKKGCHYGVRNLTHNESNFLDSCVVSGNELRVYFRNKADRITFVSDNGIIKKEVQKVAFATYEIGKNDSYVRVESRSGDESIYLNPVVRYNGYQLTYNNGFPLINTSLTILCRVLVLMSDISIILLILVLNGRAVVTLPQFKWRLIKTRREVSLG